MKDNLAFAIVLVVLLISVASTMAWTFNGPTPESALGALVAKPAPEKVRYIEPVTVVGRREALADESFASVQPEDASAAHIKPNQSVQ